MKKIKQEINNPTLATIYDRHSTRQFTDEPVAETDLKLILNAANQAPSAHNQQSWRFIVITGEKKRELVEMVSSKAVEFPKSSSVLLRMASRAIASAPVVIAVANTGRVNQARDGSICH